MKKEQIRIAVKNAHRRMVNGEAPFVDLVYDEILAFEKVALKQWMIDFIKWLTETYDERNGKYYVKGLSFDSDALPHTLEEIFLLWKTRLKYKNN